MSITDEVPIDRIKDGGAQMRVEIRPETVNEYAADLLSGATFPPVVVFYDGADYWLGDGFHRVEAVRKVERETILAEVREGTARDAILYGVGSNAAHGLRRTQADKRRAIERLLRDPEWAQWGDRKIAEAAKVDHKTVGKVRRELTRESPATVKSGEFPTAQDKTTGEIPTGSDKPVERASLVADLLRNLPDEALVSECRRRGLTLGDAGA